MTVATPAASCSFLRPSTPPAVAVMALPSIHTAAVLNTGSGHDKYIRLYLPAFRALPESQHSSNQQRPRDFEQWFYENRCCECNHFREQIRETATDEDGWQVTTIKTPPCQAYSEGVTYTIENNKCYEEFETDPDCCEDYQDCLAEEGQAQENSQAASPIGPREWGLKHPPLVAEALLTFDSRQAYVQQFRMWYQSTKRGKDGQLRVMSRRDRAQNTYNDGSVCWGNNADRMESLADFCNIYRQSAFNYDLTEPSHEARCLTYHKLFLCGGMPSSPLLGRNDYLMSAPWDKAQALMLIAPNTIAARQLTASGFPVDLGCIPLMQRLVRDIPGYVTPAHPEYGHRWFVAQHEPNRYSLIGQVHD